ncbi:hypothetical protein F4776DRAFT_652365 [Hypoxylon sp. NC0597]|nr:hypothetical protein F4776DRAFT_652365 [Hypoxylon sp. NC0597]
MWFRSPTDKHIRISGGRHKYSYISLTGLDQLQVPCVKSFVPPEGLSFGTRILNPSSAVSLTATFPNASEVNLCYDEPGPFLALQRELRDNFVASLEGFKLPPTVKTLDIHVRVPRYPHDKSLPDLRGSRPNDPLCVTINNLIRQSNVRDVYYGGSVDPSLFCTDSDGLYSSLRSLTVCCYYPSPSGKWYFNYKDSEGGGLIEPASNTPLPASTRGLFPPGYGDEDEDEAALALEQSMDPFTDENIQIDEVQFRQIPNEELVIPLLESFVRYIASIRSLRYAKLFMDRRAFLGDWFVLYSAPGHRSGYEGLMKKPDEDLSRARVFFLVGDWEPEAHVVDLFRAIGQERYGEDAIITFLEYACKS